MDILQPGCQTNLTSDVYLNLPPNAFSILEFLKIDNPFFC